MPNESVPLLDLSAGQRYELLRAIIADDMDWSSPTPRLNPDRLTVILGDRVEEIIGTVNDVLADSDTKVPMDGIGKERVITMLASAAALVWKRQHGCDRTPANDGLTVGTARPSDTNASITLGNALGMLRQLDILTSSSKTVLFDLHHERRKAGRGRLLMGSETPEALGYISIGEGRVDFYVTDVGEVAGLDADGFLSDIGIVSLKVSTEAAAALRSLTHTNWHGLADE